MAESAADLAMKVIESGCVELSKFAQESYGRHGRGAVLIRAPKLRPGTTAQVPTSVVYHTLADVRAAAARLDDADDANVLIQMIETYDPARQAIVTVKVGNGNPAIVKMRLRVSDEERR